MTKIETAMEVLKNGGYFRKALETDSYTHREMFHTRLRDASGHVVRGIGFQTFVKLESKLQSRECAVSSSWPQEWVLTPVAPSYQDISHVTEYGLTQRLSTPVRCF